jgi:3-hydroxybutyrate dehydrogenase
MMANFQGSTSGIGLSIAKLFAKNGANVLINGFGDKTAIDQLVTDLKSEYGVKACLLYS